MLPGDPALAIAGEERDPESLAFIREKYHLNEPIWVQYGYWIGGVLQGDLGISLRTNIPVTELLLQKLPVTIQLALMAITIALLVGIPMGVLRSEEHTSELQSLMRSSYAVFCLNKKNKTKHKQPV